MKTTSSTRGQILDAATHIVKREGVSRLTIEGVARESGLSKGGVLYHFRSKDDLIAGMMADLIARFEEDLERELAAEPDITPGRWLRAYIRASAFPIASSEDTAGALIAAVANNPALLAPLNQVTQGWRERALQDGVPPGLAMVIVLALDGIWYADLFGLAPLNDVQRNATIETLLHLADNP